VRRKCGEQDQIYAGGGVKPAPSGCGVAASTLPSGWPAGRSFSVDGDIDLVGQQPDLFSPGAGLLAAHDGDASFDP